MSASLARLGKFLFTISSNRVFVFLFSFSDSFNVNVSIPDVVSEDS